MFSFCQAIEAEENRGVKVQCSGDMTWKCFPNWVTPSRWISAHLGGVSLLDLVWASPSMSLKAAELIPLSALKCRLECHSAIRLMFWIANPQIFIRCPSFQWKTAPPAKFNDKWAFNNSTVFIFFTLWTAALRFEWNRSCTVARKHHLHISKQGHWYF